MLINKHTLEDRYGIELRPVPLKPWLFKIMVNNVQRVFTGYPPALSLEQLDKFLPWLDENVPDWNK